MRSSEKAKKEGQNKKSSSIPKGEATNEDDGKWGTLDASRFQSPKGRLQTTQEEAG